MPVFYLKVKGDKYTLALHREERGVSLSKEQIKVKFLLTGALVSTSFCLPAAVPVNDTLITLELPWSAVGEADKEATVNQSRPPLLSHSLTEVPRRGKPWVLRHLLPNLGVHSPKALAG